MNKPYKKLWLLALILGYVCPTFSQQYSIQLGAFTEPIASSYFDFSGFSNVNHQVTNQYIHQYTWGKFATAQSAAEQLKVLRSQTPLHNMTHLKIVPINTEKSAVSSPDDKEYLPNQATDIQLFSRIIDFNQAHLSLQRTDVQELEEIRDILDKNPELKLRIITVGHTNNLSPQQQTAAPKVIKNFLLANQIPAYRIKILASQAPTNAEKLAVTVPPVIMTLVNLKEEIVLDRFSADRLFVKDLSTNLSNNVLE